MKTSVVATSLPVVLLLLLTPIACIAAEAAPPEWRVSNMHTHPWFVEVVLASLLGWIVGMVKGFSTSADWLEKYLPAKPLLIVFLLDLLIFVVGGGYLGTGIYNPANLLEALAAGLSWPVGLGALATKN